YCMIGIQSKVTQDVPPFVMYAESEPKTINTVGLKRRGFEKSEIQSIRRAFKVIFRSGDSLELVKDQLATLAKDSAGVAKMLDFIQNSDRGIAR
ncbi:MAG: hypothetical protein OQJ89_04030, partial [Kangiellaceae bacterium]|nr:hypothetical protein [Kangiellaceae bacterium]